MDYAFWEEEMEGMGTNEPLTQPFELTQVEQHKRVCLECGSSDIIDDEGETPACGHCGAVCTGQIDETVEYSEMHRGMVRTRQIRPNAPSAAGQKERRAEETTESLEANCLKGLQAIVKDLAESLSKEVLMGDKAVVRITHKLWMGVLLEWAKGGDYPLIACFRSTNTPNVRRNTKKMCSKQANDDVEEVQSIQSFQEENHTAMNHENATDGSVIQTEDEVAAAAASPVLGLELVRPSSRATQKPRVGRKRKNTRQRDEGRITGREMLRPSMPMALAIVYCSCRWLRNGIVPIDLVRLCRDGTLPYIRAFEALPVGLQEALTAFRPFFAQSNPPSTSQLSFLAGRIALVLGLDSLPPLNIEACGLRFAAALRMPIDVISTMKAMVACAAAAHTPLPSDNTDEVIAVDIKKESTTTSQGNQQQQLRANVGFSQKADDVTSGRRHMKCRTTMKKKKKNKKKYGYEGLGQRLSCFLERASPTHVMALLVLSVRCGSFDWPSWTYNTQSSSASSFLWSPLSVAVTGRDVEYPIVPRKELKHTLEILQSAQELLNTTKGRAADNTPALPAGPPCITAMKSSGGQEVVATLDRMADNLEGNLEVWSKRVRPAQVTSGLNVKYGSTTGVKKASTWGAGLVVYDIFPNRLGRPPLRPGPTRVVPDELHSHFCLLVEICAAHLEVSSM